MRIRLTGYSAAPALLLAMAFSGAGFAHEPKQAAIIPASYEGGTLPLGHSKLKATLGTDEVVLIQHGRRISVPAASITEIACATGVHRRAGATVLGVVPYMHLGTAEDHYVGVAWVRDAAAGAKTQKVEVLFKLNKSEYGVFIAGLERLTGKKAVDTNQTLTSVHY